MLLLKKAVVLTALTTVVSFLVLPRAVSALTPESPIYTSADFATPTATATPTAATTIVIPPGSIYYDSRLSCTSPKYFTPLHCYSSGCPSAYCCDVDEWRPNEECVAGGVDCTDPYFTGTACAFLQTYEYDHDPNN